MFQIAKKETKEVIEQIHKEFNTAAEILLAQAEDIISKAEVNTDKHEKLQKFGFNKSKEMVRLSENINVFNKNKNLANIIKQYQNDYPLNKFITLQQVETICKKYNLLLGETSIYTGFVPQKNLEEIANFQGIKSEHRIYNEHGKKILISIDVQNTEHQQFYKLFNYIIEKEIPINCKNFNEFLDDAYYIGRELRSDGILNYEEFSSVGNYKSCFKANLEHRDIYSSDKLYICAPEKDMDLKDVKKKGFQLFKTSKVNFPDPVVLKPIKSGFLILTAWGDEASDPLVLNPINN